MKYKILFASNPTTLQELVTEYLDKGWQTVGGLVAMQDETQLHLYQAMILEDKGGNLQ